MKGRKTASWRSRFYTGPHILLFPKLSQSGDVAHRLSEKAGSGGYQKVQKARRFGDSVGDCGQATVGVSMDKERSTHESDREDQ